MNKVGEERKGISKKHKENKKEEIKYAMPAKPLDFSFRDLKNLLSLKTTEQRGGERRSIDELEKEEKQKQEKDSKLENKNTEEDEGEKGKNKRKSEAVVKTDESEMVEARMFENKGENIKGKSVIPVFEEKKDSKKKVVKYLTYTNAVILHSNQIESLSGINEVLNTILLAPKFGLSNFQGKLDFIQWIDISSNHLTDIHADILNLRYLKILYAHANYINEIKKVEVLSQCKCLINLTLHGNPIEQIKGFRHFIIELIPTLEKFDFTLVSEKELDIIYHRGSRYGEKRNKLTGAVVEYPVLHDKFKRSPPIQKDDKVDEKDEH